MDPRTENPYEVLGVERRATQDQIEKAYRFCRQLYSDDALGTYSLLRPHEAQEAREKVDAAYGILGDPARRQAFDATQGASPGAVVLFPGAVAVALAPLVPACEPAVRSPQVLPDPVRGSDLKRFRESRGVTLKEIASATKIGVRFLEYIEGDRREHLPAPVYLRSFLQEYARCVGLHPRQTMEAYLAALENPLS